MKDMYFWCRSGEDGTIITPMTKAQLEKEIKIDLEDLVTNEFLSEFPDADGTYWHCDENAVVIIKGRIVVPKAKEVVKTYEID